MAPRRGAREGGGAPGTSAPRRRSNPEPALLARSMVWQALDRLPPRRRAVLVLYGLEGHADPEIARLIGVTPVTVRWHLGMRARREMARQARRRAMSDWKERLLEADREAGPRGWSQGEAQRLRRTIVVEAASASCVRGGRFLLPFVLTAGAR